MYKEITPEVQRACEYIWKNLPFMDEFYNLRTKQSRKIGSMGDFFTEFNRTVQERAEWVFMEDRVMDEELNFAEHSDASSS